jgi:hypothetical protein
MTRPRLVVGRLLSTNGTVLSLITYGGPTGGTVAADVGGTRVGAEVVAGAIATGATVVGTVPGLASGRGDVLHADTTPRTNPHNIVRRIRRRQWGRVAAVCTRSRQRLMGPKPAMML